MVLVVYTRVIRGYTRKMRGLNLGNKGFIYQGNKMFAPGGNKGFMSGQEGVYIPG